MWSHACHMKVPSRSPGLLLSLVSSQPNWAESAAGLRTERATKANVVQALPRTWQQQKGWSPTRENFQVKNKNKKTNSRIPGKENGLWVLSTSIGATNDTGYYLMSTSELHLPLDSLLPEGQARSVLRTPGSPALSSLPCKWYAQWTLAERLNNCVKFSR